MTRNMDSSPGGRFRCIWRRFRRLDPKTSASACYLYVDDADALYATWQAAAVEGRLTIPKDTAYRMREFAHIDPDGNLLRVGSPLSEVGA